MIVRIKASGQEQWYYNVTGVWGSGGYVFLRLGTHPTLVHFWQATTSFLMAETKEDMVALLQAERPVWICQ